MVKLLIAILVFIVLLGISITMYTDKHSKDSSKTDTAGYSSPADPKDAANNAVQQTQDLQNDINSKAAEQLNQ